MIPTDTAAGTPVVHHSGRGEVACQTTSAPYEGRRRGYWLVDLPHLTAVPLQDVELAQLSLL